MPEPIYPSEYCPLKAVLLGGHLLIPPVLPLVKTILELLFWHGLQSLQHILLILSSVMGNLRPLRVDLIFGTAKSHSEPRLMNKVSDQARCHHLGSETRYDYKVMRLAFFVLLIKWLWRQFQKRSSKNVLRNGSIFGFDTQ